MSLQGNLLFQPTQAVARIYFSLFTRRRALLPLTPVGPFQALPSSLPLKDKDFTSIHLVIQAALQLTLDHRGGPTALTSLSE